jgi:hypothetical protein
MAQARSFGIKRPKTQEIRSWSDGEIEAYENRWPIGTKQRLAFALCSTQDNVGAMCTA